MNNGRPGKAKGAIGIFWGKLTWASPSHAAGCVINVMRIVALCDWAFEHAFRLDLTPDLSTRGSPIDKLITL